MIFDVAIIGAGPAGYSAAIYTGRAGLKTMLFGKVEKGNLYKAHVIGNYFGLADNPSGEQMLQTAERQAIALQVERSTNEIIEITPLPEGDFQLRDNLNAEYQAKCIILATGQSYVLAGIKGEKEFVGHGVSYCVICDAFFFKNRPVVVIGNSDYAAAEALELKNFTSQITILSNGKPLEFSAPMEAQLKEQQITRLETPRIASFEGKEKLEKLIFTKALENGRTEMATEGVFLAIGIAGANAFAQRLGLEMNGNYIKVDSNGLTTLPKLFAAGDCTGSPAQVAVSVGGGCLAGLSAIKLLRGLNNYIQYN